MTLNPEGLRIIHRYEEEYWTVGIHTAEKAVSSLVTVELNEDQYSAVVSFVVNIGINQFRRSDDLKLLNAGRFLEFADEMMGWISLEGEEDPTLKRRRKLERALFLKPQLVVSK